jgi:hypothetical protein
MRWKTGLKVAVAAATAPANVTRAVSRLVVRATGAWVLSQTDSLPCPGCGDDASLVGRWECGWCSYVFDGFAFSPCEVCGATPPWIPCSSCGHSVQNPMFWPSARGQRKGR